MATGSLSPISTILQFFNDQGVVLAFGKVYTYVAGTTTPLTTYSTSSLSSANANPIPLNGNGRMPAEVWVPKGTSLKMVLTDANLNPIANGTLDNIPSINDQYFSQTAREIAAGITPSDLSYPEGEIRRYGAVLDGTTDDTAALQRWASLGGGLTWSAPGTALITAQIPFISNTTVDMCGGAVIKTATTNINLFYATGKSNITIRGGHFLQTAAGASGSIAGVTFDSCTNCTVEDGEFEGMQWGGVYLNNSSYCRVARNYFHGFLGTVQNASSVLVYRASTYNIVTDNQCFDGRECGVLVQDPNESLLPVKNIVSHNVIGTHTAYGVAVYIPGVGDCYNEVIGNDIESITGSSVSGTTGCGVYVQGAGAGGTSVIGNTIRNCLTAVTGRTNAPGSIGIAGLSAIGAPITVSGNTIDMAAFYDGILLVNNAGTPITVTGNTIKCPAGNTTGDPIRIESSNNTNAGTNTIIRSTAQGRCIMVYSNGAFFTGMKDVSVTNNVCIGGSDHQIDFVTAAAGTFTNVTLNGNNVSGGASGCIPIYALSISVGSIVGNVCSGTGTYAMFVNACIDTVVDANALTTTGTVTFGASGACTRSKFGKSNIINGFIENGSTAGSVMLCEFYGTAAPSSASAVNRIGDRIENSVPVVGQPKGWRCTVAGTGATATYVSEGNL